MPALSIATWNINSVRLRVDQVARYVREAAPDVLCLQETKCRDAEFPSRAFSAMGLRHLHLVGQNGSHGVAFASRFPMQAIQAPLFCPHGEPRVAAVSVQGLTIHNVYVPAGGEYPAPASPKFQHKLELLARMRDWYAAAPKSQPLLLVGDLNIAPGEFDVWSHRQLLNDIGHSPAETEALEAVREAGGFVDVARALRPPPEKLFSWWSYRHPDWRAANRGQRLDHIWAPPALAARCEAIAFHADCRGWEKPSDHVPVQASFAM
jgi:exodeoxyribonuclease III